MEPSWLMPVPGRRTLTKRGTLAEPPKRAAAAESADSSQAPPAADLSGERLLAPYTVLPRGRGLDWLQVLVLAGTPISTDSLQLVLSQCECLRQLDASHCSLAALPPADAWSGLQFLAALFLHRNLLGQWVDVERAAAGPPRLEWLTLFENPIASQPEFRSLVVDRAPRILAVDLWVITDDERLPFPVEAEVEPESLADARPQGRSSPSRFSAFSRQSTLNMRTSAAELPSSPAVLFREARRQLQQVHFRSRYCSAAYALQSAWKLFRWHSRKRAEAKVKLGSIVYIQRHFRRLLWKRGLTRYLKGYLAEIDELDLMLSAKEMLTLRASKRIESTVRRWVQQRKERRKLRMAEMLLLRWSRGHLLRVSVQRRELQLEKYRRIYFPARCAWEFLALINVARQDCRLPRLPPTHAFDTSRYYGIRIPEASDLPRRRASITKLLIRRNSCIVRPCHAGRFPEHVWDGPFHRLLDQSSEPRIAEAYSKIGRRAAHVDNNCRRAFLRSCAPGQHPIECARPARGGSRALDDEAADFRDEFALGACLGAGAGCMGMAFECRRRTAGDGRRRPGLGTRSYVAKLVEHSRGWWSQLRAGRPAQLLALAGELERMRSLQHGGVARPKAAFVDEHFVYFVTDRSETNLASVVPTDRRFGLRGVMDGVVGEIVVQMLRSLEYVHSRGVVHRNVKAENFLLDGTPALGKPFKVMLCDFAAARFLEPGVFLKDTAGSPDHWAPEVAARAYAHGADVWAAGVIFWQLLTGKLPFAGPAEACALTLARETSNQMSQDQFDLAQALLTKQPEHRPSAEAAQHHPWLEAASEEHQRALREAWGPEAAPADPGRSRSAPQHGHGQRENLPPAWADREEKLRSSDDRYQLGEKVTVSVEKAVERSIKEHSGSEGEAPSADGCEWWSPDLCRQRGLQLPPEGAAGAEGAVAPARYLWPAAVDGFQALAWGASNAQELLQRPDAVAQLQRELETGECSLQLDAGRLVRVVSYVVLRVASPSGRVLVGASGGEEGEALRLPSGKCRVIGSGFENLSREVSRVIESELHISPHILHVHLANWQHSIVSEESESGRYPGLRDLRRRHILQASVSMEVGRAQLDALGLPGERAFEVAAADGAQVRWEWLDVHNSETAGLPPEARAEGQVDVSGFRPLNSDGLTKAGLEETLQRHGVDTRRLGIGKAHSLQQLLRDANAGRAKLCEAPPALGGGLVRLADALTVRVRSSLGLYLVRTRRWFGPEARAPSDSCPDVVLRPFEDELWAVRQLLLQWDVPFGDATVTFGPLQVEPRCEDPAYPGIPTVSLRRVVDVRLLGAATSSSGGATDSQRWLSSHPEGVRVEARPQAGAEREKDAPVSLALQELLEGPSPILPDVSGEARSAFRRFFVEARRLGSRPRCSEHEARGMEAIHGAVSHHETGLPVYRDTVWLGERLLSYDCESLRMVETLVSLLLRFEGTGGDAPLISAVPFLLERSVHEISAATCLQSAWRAHRARCALPCSLQKAATMRRAVLCIQRAWRWSLLRRRFDVLVGAAAAAEAVRSATLYIEERLLRALNLVNSVDRCAPLLRERGLGFGYSTEEEDVVLVRGDLRRRISEASSEHLDRREERRRRASRREGGLPGWLWRAAGEPSALGPDDADLAPLVGLQGLLLQGLAGEPAEGHAVTVSVQSLQYASQLGIHGEASPALASSGGQLRFVELRFRSVAQARRRALVLFLCTYSSKHRAAVPLVPKASLHSTQVCESLVKLWDAYGLTWEASDRTSVFQLRQRYSRSMEVVPISGRETWHSVAHREWLNASVNSAPGKPGRLPPIPSLRLSLTRSGGTPEALLPAAAQPAPVRLTPRSARQRGAHTCGSAASAARELTPRERTRRRPPLARGVAVMMDRSRYLDA